MGKVGGMRGYRAFVIGADGRIMGSSDIWAEDDEAAKEQAKQLVDGHDVELWHLTERIAEFKSKQ